MNEVEVDDLVRAVRTEFGSRFPLGTRDETHDEQVLREERTRLVLQREVLPELAARRASERAAALTPAEEAALVEHVIGAMFGLPNLLRWLRDPSVTDILVFGSDPVRIESLGRAPWTAPPLVRRDRDLEALIYEVAARKGRPFHREVPFVDLELEQGVRFHGSGFDVVQRPFIAVRRASMFGSGLDDLYDRGTLDEGAVELLRAAVGAGFRMVFVGAMAAGKTTCLRATASEIDRDLVIATVESDFELNIAGLGHRNVVAYQERIPATLDGHPITPAQLMRPAMRSRAHWLLVGEVRGGEGAALLRAMQTGQGAMATVHGGSAQEGLEVWTDLVTAETGQNRQDVRRSVYRATDLVIHIAGTNTSGRAITEIIAPGILDEGDKIEARRLYAPNPRAVDHRARPATAPSEDMTQRLVRAMPSFSTRWWYSGVDTYKPLTVGV